MDYVTPHPLLPISKLFNNWGPSLKFGISVTLKRYHIWFLTFLKVNTFLPVEALRTAWTNNQSEGRICPIQISRQWSTAHMVM